MTGTDTQTILLVDDDEQDVELMLIGLETCSLPAQVEVARDGAQALEYLRCQGSYTERKGGNPTLILLDLKMPKVDGFDVLREVRHDSRFEFIPIIALTSSRERQDVENSYRLGANSYVVKPVDFESFITTVAEIGQFWTQLNQTPQSFSPSCSRKETSR